MIRTDIFDYINVLDKAADAAWLRNDAIANNIANASTPGYKRQDVRFEEELARALRSSRFETLDAKVSNLKGRELQPVVYTDAADYSYRLDGNNVDPEAENVYLAKNTSTYNAIMNSIQKEFSDLKSVMK